VKSGGPGSWFRAGLSVGRGVIGLFGAGAVLFEAHKLFLRYYQREWQGIQFTGVNGCQGEEALANGDLFQGQTYCNQPENFVPWVQLYQRHWQAAAVYYGIILTVLLTVGFTLSWIQHRIASQDPFGAPAKAVSPADSEHFR
jgi:hypothetical protein